MVFLASIATISACLFLFGLFYSIVANFQNILKTEPKQREIGQEIAKRAEVSEVQFQSADDAWATFDRLFSIMQKDSRRMAVRFS